MLHGKNAIVTGSTSGIGLGLAEAFARPEINRCGVLGRMNVTLPSGYHPSKDKKFMSSRMLENFRRKLLDWRAELVHQSNNTLQHLQEGDNRAADIADRASIEIDRSLELRTRDRARKLIAKIDEAMDRIENGSYGYCEESHEPISLSRLEARPIATLSVAARERHERKDKTHRDE